MLNVSCPEFLSYSSVSEEVWLIMNNKLKFHTHLVNYNCIDMFGTVLALCIKCLHKYIAEINECALLHPFITTTYYFIFCNGYYTNIAYITEFSYNSVATNPM